MLIIFTVNVAFAASHAADSATSLLPEANVMLGDALLTPHPSICGSRTRIEPPAGTSPVAMNEISADVLTPGVSSVELNELRPENDPDLIELRAINYAHVT